MWDAKHQTQDTGYLLGGAGMRAGAQWGVGWGNVGAPIVSVTLHVRQHVRVIPSLTKAGVRVLSAKRRKALDTMPYMQPAPDKSQLILWLSWWPGRFSAYVKATYPSWSSAKPLLC